MGTTMAPELASIVVAHYEEQYLNNLYRKPLVWIHYIDDVLAIWPYSKDDFLEFFNGLNLFHFNLKFTMEISYVSIQFLELTIFKDFSFFLEGSVIH